MQSFWPKGVNVIAIVPAFNEAKYIANVLRQLKQRKQEGLIREIVVADDGSKDRTAEIAKQEGADTVLRLKRNQGKIRAFAEGVRFIAQKYAPKERFKKEKERQRTMESIIVLTLDADLKDVKARQIRMMVNPLLFRKKIDMTIGESYQILPEYIGQRAIRLRALGGLLKGTKLWRKMLRTGYGQERTLDHLIRNQRVVPTFFIMNRACGREKDLVLEEMYAAKDYLAQRVMLAHQLSQRRRLIKGMELPAKKRREIARSKLKIAREQDKANFLGMMQQIRKARKRARRR